MLSMLLAIIKPLSAVAIDLVSAKGRLLDAATEKERIQAEVEIQQLEGRQAVLIAEQGSRLTSWIRPAFAFPFIVYNFKVVVWDKVLGLGVTDDLSASYWQLQIIIFGAYFLTRAYEKRTK